MVMCYLHPYQISTKTGAPVNPRFLEKNLGIIKYKQNVVKHNSMILLKCILTLSFSMKCFGSTSHLQVDYFFLIG